MNDAAASPVYRRHDDVVTRTILGEVLLVPISSAVADMDNIYAMNDTGAFVWQRLDGATPLGDVLAALAAEFEVDSATAWADLTALLDELLAAGLVEPVG